MSRFALPKKKKAWCVIVFVLLCVLQSNQCATLCRNGEHLFKADLQTYTLGRRKKKCEKLKHDHPMAEVNGAVIMK